MATADLMRAFLEQQPLYSKTAMEMPAYATGFFPDVLELDCPVCGNSRPFRDPRPSGSGAGTGGPALMASGLYGFYYRCTGCSKAEWRCWVDVNESGKWVRKVGQLPAWTIAVGKDLERHLGAAAEHYKRALICLSQSYGLAACAYLRRVLEDTIDPLLRLELDVKTAEGAPKSELDALAAAIASKVFEVKTELAYRHAPHSIVVDGDNPLKLIHDQLSIGVHRLTEDECVTVAVTLSTALEYVVKELNRQRDARAAFASAIRKAARGAPDRPA